MLDVRTQAEWKKNQYEDALHVPRPALSQDLDGLPNNRTIAVICGSGYRSSIAASLFLARGFPSLQKRDGRHGSLRKNEVPADGIGRPCLRVVIRSNFSERGGRDKL